MLLHGHAVAHGQRQGAPASALAQKHAHHRNGKARHGHQIVGDGVALAALLGLGAAEGALGVHQTENRPAELLRLAHEAQRLAVALGLGASEVAGHAVGQVHALLLGNDRHGMPRDPPDAGEDGPVVGEGAVAVQLDEALHDAVEVASGRGTAHVAGDLH